MAHRAGTAYGVLAQSLREQILSGSLAGGAQLPTERELCARSGVSRITVRRALQILEEEALVVRRQGNGTFVCSRASRKIPIVNVDFSRSVRRHAPELQRSVQAQAWRTADPDVATALGIPAGERVLYVRRADVMGGRIVAVDEAHLVGRFADRLTEGDLAAVAFLERWQGAQGITLDYESQTIEALAAAGPLAAWLGVRKGSPVLKETNVVYLPGGRAAGLFVSYYRHEYYQFNSTARIGARERAK